MWDISLAACITLWPVPAWRSARHRVLTLKSPKTCLVQAPSGFPCLKHHSPAPNPQPAQEYIASHSTEIGDGSGEAKPFNWNQSLESCWLGLNEIWIWTSFDRESYWAGFCVLSPLFMYHYSVNREPVLPTTTSSARPPWIQALPGLAGHLSVISSSHPVKTQQPENWVCPK